MELTQETVAQWFDHYFEVVNAHDGSLDTVAEIGKLYADDADFVFYTNPGFGNNVISRDELMILMVHPGVYERITPEYYAINLEKKINAVHFKDQISTDKGELGEPFFAAAHYCFRADAEKGLKITRVYYWTSTQTPETVKLHIEAFGGNARKAMFDYANRYIHSKY